MDEDPPRTAWLRPEVSFVLFAEALAGVAVRLARDAAKDEIHEATEASAWEGSGIVPNRRLTQETPFHRRNQSGDGEGFDLHKSDWLAMSKSELDGGVKAASAGTE